jgi:hypothetical protein
MCGKTVRFESRAVEDPEAPEMIRPLSTEASFGVVAEAPGRTAVLVVTCSGDCTERLLIEGEAP